VLKNSNWYLQGYCTTRNDFRIFSISNMSSLETQNETFIPREFDYESMDFYFRTDRKKITLKLRIDESLRELMTEFCGEDKIEDLGDNKYIAYFPFVEDDYMYKMILQFGEKCECLEPENIRSEIVRRIRNMLNVYINPH